MNKYSVKPTDGTAPFEVEAASVEVSETSGRITFKDDDGNIVASLLNVSFHKLPTA